MGTLGLLSYELTTDSPEASCWLPIPQEKPTRLTRKTRADVPSREVVHEALPYGPKLMPDCVIPILASG